MEEPDVKLKMYKNVNYIYIKKKNYHVNVLGTSLLIVYCHYR